jgi:hypothetical protein
MKLVRIIVHITTAESFNLIKNVLISLYVRAG